MEKAKTLILLAFTLVPCQAAPVDYHGGSDVHFPLTVKILNALKGEPAANVALKVFRQSMSGTWEIISSGNSDMAGEVHQLLTEQNFEPGLYRVEFDSKAYWKSEGQTSFHQVADVEFEAHADGHQHYILALLMSPFSYTSTAVVSKAHH